jgi:hypothetical protein
MASIAPVLVQSLIPQVQGNNVAVYSWTLSTGDVGLSIQGPGFADRSFQVTGTFGGASIIIEGSNDGSNYYTLDDPFGNALSISSAALKQVTEVAWYIRPRVSGGSGVAITVTAVICSHQPNFS